MDKEVPKLNIELPVDEPQPEMFRPILEVLRPHWGMNLVKIEEKSTGYINTNYALEYDDGARNGIFVRIVNKSFMPQQLQRSLNAMWYLRRQKLGAELLLTFNNGFVVELLEGRDITWADDSTRIKNPPTWLSLAREVATFHAATNWDDAKKYNLPTTIDRIEKANRRLRDLRQAGSISDSVASVTPSPEELMQLWTNIIENLDQCGAPTTFCHNDLNPTNILIQDDGKAVLIDYDDCQLEYSCMDIARLFVTLAGAVNFDMSKLPSEDEKDAFIREYLRSLHEFEPKRGPVTEKVVQFWHLLIRKGYLMAYLWCIETSVFLIGVSEKPIDLAISRIAWEEYQKTSPDILAETFTWDD